MEAKMIAQTTLDIVEVLRFGTPSEKRGCLIGMGFGELARTYEAAVVAYEDAASRWRDCPRRAMTDAEFAEDMFSEGMTYVCLLYTSPSPRDKRQSRMPSSA